MDVYTFYYNPKVCEVRIRPEPWSNRPTKWIWRKSIITLLYMRNRLLTMLRWWICIFSLICSFLLFLSSSFLLILGQELLETPPFLFVVSEFFWSCPVSTDLVPFFWSCPPSVEFFDEASRDFFFCSDLGSPMTTFFLFVDSVWLGQIRTLRFYNSIVCTGKWLLSICICGTTNRLSLTTD